MSDEIERLLKCIDDYQEKIKTWEVENKILIDEFTASNDIKSIHRLYYFGGLTQASQLSHEALREVVKLKDEYIQLLSDELAEVMPLVNVHNFWRSKRIEQGNQLRERILIASKALKD